MRRGPLIVLGLCVVAAGASAGGWYVLREGDPLQQARTLMQQGDNRGAQLALRDLVRRRPDLAEAHLRLALVQLRLGDPIAAEHELHEAVSHGADEHAVRPLLAQALVGQNQSAVVLRDYTDAGLDPAQSADLHIARAIADLQLKQYDQARTEALAAKAAAPASAEAALNLARVEQAAGDLPAAGRAVDQVLALDPHLYSALSLRARILVQQNKLAEAIAAFDAAFADPSSKAVNLAGDRLMQANLYLGQGNDAAARQDVELALQAAPRAPLGNYLLAALDARAGQWRAADEALNAVGTALAGFPRGDLLVASVKINVGQPQQALDAAEHFNTRYPTDLAGARMLAEVYLAMGRAPAVIRLLAPWAAGAQPDPGVLATLSQAYAAAGQPGDAQAALQRAAAGSQNNPAAMTRIASLALREGNPSLGSDVLQTVLKSDQPAPAGGATPVNVPGTPAAPTRADTAAALVVVSLRAGQVDRAAAALDVLRAAHGDPKQLALLTGAVRLAQVDLPAARAAFEDAHRIDPASSQIVADLARVLMLQGDRDGATTLLHDALAKQPADPLLVTAWIQRTEPGKLTEEAIPVVQAAHAAAPDVGGFSLLLSEMYLQAKQPDKALALADSLPADSALQLGMRADADRALGHGAEALAAWQALLAKTPQDSALRRRIAGFLIVDGNFAAAATIIDQGLESHPDDAGLQADAVALAARKDGPPAGISRAEAFAAHSTQLATLVLKGDLLMATRNFTDAAAAYAQVAAAPGITPEDAETLTTRRATALLAAGDNAGGTKLLRDWVAAHPDSVPVTEMLAEADIAADRIPEARTRLEAVLQRAPSNSAALNNLAWVLQQQGDYEKSRPLANQAYALAPSAQSADTLGWAMFKTGKPSQSVLLLRQAAEGQPGDATVQYHYAAALKQDGKADAAKAVLKPVLDSPAVFKDRADATALMQSLSGP